MIDVRIVCTHDGLKTAQTLERVLAAEGRGVEISYGRASLALLEAARERKQAVILIWSLDAPVSSYMLQWRQRIEPAHLIEIAQATYPVYQRRWPVIDFSSWSGGRGSAAWRALNERLRVIARVHEPPSKLNPKRAAIALGAMSALAVTSAVLVRVHEASNTSAAAPAEDQLAANLQSYDGQGGPLGHPTEPASIDDENTLVLGPIADPLAPIELSPPPTLLEASYADPLLARPEPLLSRIADLAEPLLGRDETGDPQR